MNKALRDSLIEDTLNYYKKDNINKEDALNGIKNIYNEFNLDALEEVCKLLDEKFILAQNRENYEFMSLVVDIKQNLLYEFELKCGSPKP